MGLFEEFIGDFDGEFGLEFERDFDREFNGYFDEEAFKLPFTSILCFERDRQIC